MGNPVRKIGIVSEYFYPHLGGVTEHVYYFSKELLKKGFQVVLLTGFVGEEIDTQIPPELKVVRLGKSFPIFSNHSFAKITLAKNLGRKIKRILAEEKFDLLHIHSPLMPVLPLLFQKYSDTVTIGTFHTYFDSMGASFYYKIFRRLFQKYLDKLDGKIVVGPSCVEAMDRFFKAEYTLIPNGVETSWFSNPKGQIQPYQDGIKNILFLGRLDPRNGLDILLESFPLVLEKIPHCRLIVVGDGPMRSLYEKKVGSLLGKKIFFEGQINGNRPDYFATSDVFCYPATKASFGITLLEAMAAGRPIVAADNKGFSNLLKDGINGILYKKEDPRSLSHALVKVLQDPVLSNQLVQNNKKTIEQYSWPKVTDQIIEFYNQVYFKKKGQLFAS